MKRALLPLILSTALAGCTAGPDYVRPTTTVDHAPSATGDFVSAKGPAFEQAPLPPYWWRLYNDPRLNDLVEQALAANASLKAADANLRKADAVVRENMGQRGIGTSVAADTDLERNYSTQSAGVHYPGVATYDLGLSLSYPLDVAGKLRRAIQASEADRDAVKAARDAVRISVAAATTKAYADVCAANYQMATVKQVIALQQKTYDATRRLQRGGRGTAFDVSRARTAVETSKASLPALIARRQNSLYLLATLLGRPPAEYPKQVASCAALPTLDQPMPVGDGAALIRRRPDIRQAERRIAGDTARIGVTMADLYPSISIGGGIISTGQVKNIGQKGSFGFSFGPLLSWSFPNRPIIKARIDQAKEQVAADIAGFDQTVLDALRGTESALESYARDIDQATALAQAADSADLSARQADKLFRFGRSDFLNLLSAQSALASVRVNHAAAQAKLVDDQIAVFLALGGGWQQPAPATAPKASAAPNAKPGQ